jgi:signal transduction histidine kinase
VTPRIARGTLRLRLTLLTSGVFLVVGAILLAVTYLLVAATLPNETPAEALLHQEVLVCEAQAAAAGAAPATQNGRTVPQPAIPEDKAFCHDVFQQTAHIRGTSDRSSTLHDLLLYSAIVLAVMTAVAAGASWVLAGRALRPLRQITDAAGRASRATLGQRIDLPGRSGELKDLADTFDDMLDRLDAAFAAQERFVADASHELRTPLTALRAVVEVNLAKVDPTPTQLERMGGDILGLLEQAEALIAALLMLSRSDSRVTVSEPLDLASVVDDALRTHEDELTVERELPTTPVYADRLLLERAVANLVHNAVFHNDERRWVRGTTFSENGESGATIESTGRVITASEADQLFRPFYRAAARTGTGHGLGLAIVRSVVLAHGGRCEATPRPSGGLAVTIVLPNSGDPRHDTDVDTSTADK